MRFTRLCLVVGAFVSCSVSAWAREEPQFDAAAAAVGASTYKTYCAACHGAEAKGDGPLAADLRTRPSDLTVLSRKNEGTFPFDMIAQIIDGRKKVKGHGSQDMPIWGDAFRQTAGNEARVAERIREMTHFLWSLQEGKAD
jgi:Cytochrome C oxidase, cbb3-type, subunit III